MPSLRGVTARALEMGWPGQARSAELLGVWGWKLEGGESRMSRQLRAGLQLNFYHFLAE